MLDSYSFTMGGGTIRAYHLEEASLVRRIKLALELISFANHQRRFLLQTAVFQVKNQDQPRYWQRAIRPCPIPFLKVWNGYHLRLCLGPPFRDQAWQHL